VKELMPTVEEMVTDGLITVQEVTVIKSASKDRKQDGHVARDSNSPE
jgi:hypothetical protein